ncbi:MAG: flagellar basal body P-ring protein FlgI [Planctomycetota bacterium]
MDRPIDGTPRRLAATLLAVLMFTPLLHGCTSARERAVVRAPVDVEVGPGALRGTIGRETTLLRARPVVVSGYGMIVGLNGTGSTDVPEAVAATMEREILTLSGGELDFSDTVFAGLSPRQILRRSDTAVVIVEGAVAPGGPDGMRFDVRVRALPGSTATSLEGGRLLTTRLQLGPPITLGGPQTEIIAEARGEVYINPFAAPGELGPQRRIGRVLGGGVLIDPQPLELVLQNPLHSRAVAITRAINQRFPDGPRGEGSTAFGRDDQVIQVYTPDKYHDRFEDFVRLMMATPINQNFPDATARRYTRALVADTSIADELVWALRAIGPRALPFVQDLYVSEDPAVQLAALGVGASLNDPRAAVFLERLVVEGDQRTRLGAVTLLGMIDGGRTSDEVLRQAAGYGRELTFRIAAYESLMQRAERARLGRLVEAERNRFGAGQRATETQLRLAAASRIPPGNAQQVERVSVGGRFLLDLLPFGEPLIYVTQQGRPRIAVFGERTSLEPPLMVDAWSDRLLIAADDDTTGVRLRYERPNGRGIVTQTVSPRIADLIVFLARGGTASDFGPGLGFTYAQVVGTLAAIQEDRATPAGFATEEDRLRALILAAADRSNTDRPALLEEGEEDENDPEMIAGPDDEPRRQFVVTVPRKSEPEDRADE